MAVSSGKHSFFITCPRNVEELLGHELIELGIKQVRPNRLGVYAEMNREEVYRVVYGTRIGSRVLRPIATFPCRDESELYSRASQMQWNRILDIDTTFRIDSVVFNTPGLTHSQFASQRLKDAICDYFMNEVGERPSVDKDEPHVPLHLHVQGSKATISLNYSGGIVHRRGYRKAMVTAPLKENLAAALLRFAGWNGDGILVDLFTGSGTFLIEGAMIASKTPASFFKTQHGFQSLLDYDKETWNDVYQQYSKEILTLTEKNYWGIDIDPDAVTAAKRNLKDTPWAGLSKILERDCLQWDTLPEGALVVANAPYGERLNQKDDNLRKLYIQLGARLSKVWRIKGALVLLPDAEIKADFEKAYGKKPKRCIEVDNGQIRIQACYFEGNILT